MTEQAVIIGNQIRILFGGETLDTDPETTADADHKPEADDPSWKTLPCVDTADLEQDSEKREVWCAKPGIRVRTKVIATKRKDTWKVTLQEISLLLWQIITGKAAPDGTTASFQPAMEGGREVWVEIKQYDHANDLWVTNTLWAFMAPSGNTSFNDDIVKATLEFHVLYSTSNTSVAA